MSSHNQPKDKYLFCYFVGNAPEEEAVHFAVSTDGYNFDALNSNKSVITQKLGKKCCRDPFIFRAQNNKFYIIATDMRCYDGWASNNSMVLWESDDLINWYNERVFDFSQFESTKTANRVWAPEIMYDKNKDEYMIYWSNQNQTDDLSTVIWCIYTKDFKSFTTQPRLLFKSKSNMAGIDGDIIEKDGIYHLFYADEAKDGVCLVTSDTLDGPYTEIDDNKISVSDVALEGSCIYKNYQNGKYVLIADRFRNGGYFMQQSDDLIHFTKVPDNEFSLNHLRPRHGSMLNITTDEYNLLVSKFRIGE